MIILTWHNPLTWLAIAAALAWIAFHAISMWRQERRVQCVEHEIAMLHANGAPGPGPTTPEVSRRYEQMKVEG